MKSFLQILFLCVLFSVGLTSSIYYTSLMFSPPKLATVNMTGLIHDFVKTESTLALSPEQHRAQVHAFSQQLDRVLQTFVQEKHVILVPKEAVIAGSVVDVTAEVESRLKAFQPADATPIAESEK